jgi:ABC-type molybdate transport system substrate-binding protein
MIRTAIYFLMTISLIVSFGCGAREPVVIELYCNETFWYVMQEEARAFYSIYGMRVVMIPIRAERTDERLEPVSEEESPTEASQKASSKTLPDVPLETSTDFSRRAPVPWRSSPKNAAPASPPPAMPTPTTPASPDPVRPAGKTGAPWRSSPKNATPPPTTPTPTTPDSPDPAKPTGRTPAPWRSSPKNMTRSPLPPSESSTPDPSNPAKSTEQPPVPLPKAIIPSSPLPPTPTTPGFSDPVKPAEPPVPLPEDVTPPPIPTLTTPDSPDPVEPAEPPKNNVPLDKTVLKQITFLTEGSTGDLYLTDSARQIARIRSLALSAHEYPLCYLTLNLLVHKGNPQQFDSVQSVFKQNRRLGVVDPSKDGLGETTSDVLAKIMAKTPNIPDELVLRFDRQYDLLEALELGKIDAALVWDASNLSTYLLSKYAAEYNDRYRQLLDTADKTQDIEKIRNVLKAINAELLAEKSFAEYVPLPASDDPNQINERRVINISLISLSSATEYGYGQRFADFLRSSRGREILERFGFTAK